MSTLEKEKMQVMKSCLACDSGRLSEILDLGDQPLANSFTKSKEFESNSYPLRLNYCKACTHLQLSHCVSRSKIFEEYIYVSGTTKTLKKDFEAFAIEMTNKHGVGRVLDIACNDGSQLDAFASLGWETFGIDPAKNLYEISSQKHNILCDYLSNEHLDLGEFTIVVAQNVLAHTDNPLEFLTIAGKLSKNVYIQTSQAMMVFDGQFDTIYHEHLSFFSENSMKVLAERAGLTLTNVSLREIHGGSFLFHVTNAGISIEPKNLVTEKVLVNFSDKASTILRELAKEIEQIKKLGVPLIGYGAAAKGMTVLNSAGIELNFLIDDSPFKQGMYTPGSGIPIKPIESLLEMPETICLLPLAWNFAEEILLRVQNVYDGRILLLKYFPKVELT